MFEEGGGGVSALQIKDAIDRENIFNFEVCVNTKV